jgi:transposase
MANKLKVQEQQAVIHLAKQGWGIRKIARDLGISRNTVRGYVRALDREDPHAVAQRILESGSASVDRPETQPNQTDPLPTAGPGKGRLQIDPLLTAGKTGRRSLCLEYSDRIVEKLEAGLKPLRIYQDLKAEAGFTGSYESVKRFARKLGHMDPQLVHRIEVQPGEEVQVDFGAGPMLIDAAGKKRRTWIFRVVLSYSRKAYSEAVLRQDTETFVRCLENAFRHFGGSSVTTNLDNLKAAVLKADWADPELNPKLADFARHYGTTVLPCLPRVPEHKGKVESSIKYVKRALACRKFGSLAELNQWLAHWEKTVADVRIHGTTKRQVAELFHLEKPSLIRLPDGLFPAFREGPRTVHRDGHVEVEKAFYHVPVEYLRRDVWVRYDSREVRIFAQQKDGALKQIQVHRRLEPGQFTNPRGIGGGHGTLQANLHYWLSRASELGCGCEQWAKAVATHRQIGAIRTLMGLVGLTNRHPLSQLNQACQRAHAKGAWRLRDVRALLEAAEIQPQLPFDEHHPLIRNLTEYGVFIRNQTQNRNS